jgi:sigma-B regulation protein RsbU (phosphoserine phosphatase)
MDTTVKDEFPGEGEAQLVCWKVWGGNRRASTRVSIPGLRGVLHALPKDGDTGGDLYFLSACGSGAIARLCLADVTGHGGGVAEFSAALERVFGDQIHRENPALVLREVNQRTVTRNLDTISTGVCLSYNSMNGTLLYANAGHPHILLRRAGAAAWETLALSPPDDAAFWNIPLGVDTGARYQVGRVKLHPGDQLLLVTDGLTEARAADGTLFGYRLMKETQHPGASPDVTADTLLDALHAHAGGAEQLHDDVTFTVLEVLPYQRSNRYVLLVRNNWRKILRPFRRG